MYGTILACTVRIVGDALELAALEGDTAITLTNVERFVTETGAGSLEIADQVYDYTSADATTQVITLTTGLIGDLDEGEPVYLSPRVTEKWATVELQADDDAVFALIPAALWDRIPEGVREPEDQEAVVVGQQEGDWTIADVLGTVPVTDGELIDPDTLPVPAEIGQIADNVAQLVTDVSTNTEELGTTQATLENVLEMAQDAGALASIANVTTTVSDYPPSPEDGTGRRNGSLWIVRTRARVNYVTNPSFEVNISGWTSGQAAIARELAPVILSGSYVLRVENSGVAALHYVLWNNGGGVSKQPASPGQVFTASVFAAAVSGTNTGVYLQMQFHNAANASVGHVNGNAVDLLVDDYQRISVTATAPADAAYVVFYAISPAGNEGAIWRLDGALLEQDDIVGKYFDGRSYDATWDPPEAPDAAPSVLAGGRVLGFYELDDNGWTAKQFSSTVLGDIDATAITHATPRADGSAGFDGELIQDYSVPQDKLAATPCTASEALLAGDLVNIHSSSGFFRMRKADADNGRPAHGFVLTDVASEQIGYYYTGGYNPYVTGLSPGVQWLSTTPGKCASTPPSAVGSYQQRVGVAAASVILNFMYSPPLKIT